MVYWWVIFDPETRELLNLTIVKLCYEAILHLMTTLISSIVTNIFKNKTMPVYIYLIREIPRLWFGRRCSRRSGRSRHRSRSRSIYYRNSPRSWRGCIMISGCSCGSGRVCLRHTTITITEVRTLLCFPGPPTHSWMLQIDKSIFKSNFSIMVYFQNL